jgi:hypothetical protein
MAYADQKFRHDLRNTLNSFALALKAYEISDDQERVEFLEMIVHCADEAIAVIDQNPPDFEPTPPATK